MVQLTTEQELELAEAMSDPVGFPSCFVQIPNKDRQRVPFVPWPVQERLLRSFTGRDVVVKDSQCGSTSIFSEEFLRDTVLNPDTTTVIMSHNEETTKRLLRRTWVMFDSLPNWMKPRVDHNSANELRFPDINSVIYIATAKAEVAGRGEPIHNLLFSEYAFYGRDAKNRIVLPAIERVPSNGRVIKESTPNGQDELLYQDVQEIRAGERFETLHVVPWWENITNVEPEGSQWVPPDEKQDFEWTVEEEGLSNKALEYSGVPLTMEQVRWRRRKIRDMGQLFYQEHLEDLDTCFIVMGEPYYNPVRMLQLQAGCYRPQRVQDCPIERTQVWFPPEEGKVYVMGVDPGQGKVTESVASIWEWRIEGGPKHCASLATMDDPLSFDQPVLALARWYNDALIVPEANGHGQGLIALLRNWHRLYYRTTIGTGRISQTEIGWLTTAATKPFMMQQMDLQLPVLETYDSRLVNQIAAWRKDTEQRPIVNGMTDHFMAACLALVAMAVQKPNPNRGFRGNVGWSW